MSRQLSPVDDEVFEALQQLAEPLVDDLNSVLRRLLGLDKSTLPPNSDVISSPESQSDSRPVERASRKSRSARSSNTKRGRSRPRAARGTLLPESEYEEPVLRVLAARGGSAPASEVVEEVGAVLSERFTPADREMLDSGLTRWKSRVQFVRLKLVQAGQMKKGSPRGIWEMTPAGLDRLEGQPRNG